MFCRLTGICLMLWLAASPLQALEITLDRPGEREFVRDNANLLSPHVEDDPHGEEVVDLV